MEESQAPPRRRRALVIAVQAVMSAVALVLVIRMVSGEELRRALAGARLAPLALALACVVLDRVLMAAKWGILLRAQGLKRPLAELVRIYFVSTFFGSFLPTGVGADVIRVFQVARGKGEMGAATASVIMERALGLIALATLVLVCLSTFVLRERADLAPFLGVVVLVLVLGFGGLAWALHGRLPARLARFVEVFRVYAGHRPALARFFGFSVVEHLVPVIANYFLARALGIELSLWTFLLVIPIVLFLVRIPISLDGLGIQEGLYVTLFAHAGLGPSQAFLLSLAGRAALVIGLLPGCFLGLRSRRQLAGRVRAGGEAGSP
jgi:uncharacterized membrane protein YbhN (UPF0104 family)